ncbi:helix-turn-helix transcriptional regulator [Nitrincola iocasae]|uniref:WYL domain-containing protein n=1 Tax=Nitrincola iocasae TaxID=2614693 RepID=A0A5J6LBP3_9GAMM|nr:WYL domain-containing protein [Nitrincola iocasae]QEW05890.1 WYL domain-containing protein [Nitrincola iocasae]
MVTEKHEVLLRMRAIELLALWEGRIITNRLVDWFGVSRQQASLDIKRYVSERNPGSLVYSPSAKGYVPSPNFHPVISHGHVSEYLNLIAGIPKEPIAITLEANDHITAIQLPDCSVMPEVLREVIKACKAKFSLEIIYASMSNPTPHNRSISPHTLIYTGFRWHVRAFCHTRQEYRDFILSRIFEPKLSKAQYVGSSNDYLWNEFFTLILIANQHLSLEQKKLIEQDFCMSNGKLEVHVRKALAHYVLQRFQVGITDVDASEKLRFPVMIAKKCKVQLENLLFESEEKEELPSLNLVTSPKKSKMDT